MNHYINLVTSHLELVKDSIKRSGPDISSHFPESEKEDTPPNFIGSTGSS